MRLLLKDYSTEKKSFTITILVLGILAVIASDIVATIKMINSTLTSQDVAYFTAILSFQAMGLMLYFNKRKFQFGPLTANPEEDHALPGTD